VETHVRFPDRLSRREVDGLPRLPDRTKSNDVVDGEQMIAIVGGCRV
jgi:hypothetical protein